MIELPSQGLLLNPRAPTEVSSAQIAAWNQYEKEDSSLFTDSIGISTSGSMSGGIGSIVVLSRQALEVSALSVNRRLDANGSDVWGLALPLFHVGGYSIPLRAGLSGSQVATFGREWSASEFYPWLQIEKVSLLSLVPTQLFDLVNAGLKSPPQLRALVVGGGRLDSTLHLRARELGWPVMPSYGLTECSSQVATATRAGDGTALEVLDHVEVRSLENQKLWIRSKSLLSARIVFDRDLRSVVERPVTAEGWFETSDRAEILRIGFSDGVRDVLKILGREGDTVKVLAELVDLVRVRAEIDKLTQGVSEFSKLAQRLWVVAIPHTRREHELVLVFEEADESSSVSASTVASVKRLVTELRRVLAPYEMPTRLLRVEKIPRSSLGKVLSSLLTDEARKRTTDSL
jgi:o-succinylbenzoate---CoA ligase